MLLDYSEAGDSSTSAGTDETRVTQVQNHWPCRHRVTSNVIYGPYPTPGGGDSSFFESNPGNYFPANRNAVGFEDLAKGNYSLAASARYKGKPRTGKTREWIWGSCRNRR
jgi:hypothetical protein